MVLDGRAWTAFAHTDGVSEVVVGASLVSGGLAPAVANQRLPEFRPSF